MNSEEVIKCEGIYQFNRRVNIMLEYMDQGSMEKIIEHDHMNYSEDFCRYTLYKVAKGMNEMHNRNVLHRDIKSDNILMSSDGEIKITDLGFAKPLS